MGGHSSYMIVIGSNLKVVPSVYMIVLFYIDSPCDVIDDINIFINCDYMNADLSEWSEMTVTFFLPDVKMWLIWW